MAITYSKHQAAETTIGFTSSHLYNCKFLLTYQLTAYQQQTSRYSMICDAKTMIWWEKVIRSSSLAKNKTVTHLTSREMMKGGRCREVNGVEERLVVKGWTCGRGRKDEHKGEGGFLEVGWNHGENSWSGRLWKEGVWCQGWLFIRLRLLSLSLSLSLPLPPHPPPPPPALPYAIVFVSLSFFLLDSFFVSLSFFLLDSFLFSYLPRSFFSCRLSLSLSLSCHFSLSLSCRPPLLPSLSLVVSPSLVLPPFLTVCLSVSHLCILFLLHTILVSLTHCFYSSLDS